MFRTLFISLFCSFPFLLSAQVLSQAEAQKVVHGSETVRISPETGKIEYIRFQPDQRMSLQELVAKKQPWMPAQFHPSDFHPLRMHQDKMGMRHHRYQVTRAGIPIEGAVIIVHEKEGKVVSLNGEMYSLSGPAPTQPIAESIAWRNALAQIGDSEHKRASTQWSYLKQHPSPGTLVYAPQNGDFKQPDFRLAWKFDLYLTQPLYRSWVYVDAQTGEVIWESNRIHTSDVQATAVTKYSGTRTITTDSVSPMLFELFESGRGGGITTRNMVNGFSIGNSVPFVDTDNYWNNVNANQNEVATDAHLGAEVTYDYYLNTYGWNSFDNQGGRIRSYVHFSVGYENAYWDGVNVVYGDGGGGTFSEPLACPEICGHEITHGVTEFSAGLLYFEEFGALNESFSDIFGTVIEAQFYPSSWDWNIGGQVTPNAQGIRNMQDPTLHGDPDCYGGPLWVNGADVHYNSGVQNKWFYILTAGDADTNAIGNIYNVTGIGMQKAAAIAFRNLTTYLTPTSTYTDARFYAIESAKDLYGNCSAEMIATADAWYAVGVGQPYQAAPVVSFTAYPPSVCSLPAAVSFSNTSSPAASYFWDFGDGNTDTTSSPVHTYTNYGLYTVKLVVEGCTGILDSVIMTDLIHVDTNAICPVTMDSAGIDTFTKCEGILLDPGGQFDYPNEVNSTVVIAPPNATNLRLTFTDFATENNFDFLSVFDGPSTSSPLIGRYSGPNLPNGGVILTSGPEVTILFTSDVISVDEGFVMEWECISASDPPIADFHTSFPVTCTGQMAFYDRSIGTINTWSWDFGDGSTSTLQNPIHTYTASGTYAVSLEVCNGAGCDTLIKNGLVTVDLGGSACDTSLFPSIGRYTYIDCKGFLMDDGGTNDYSSNQNTTVVINPPGATGIQLDFSQFRTEWSADFLYIYDGPSNQSPIIGFYTGNNLPQGGTIRSSGGAITLNFRVSQFGNEEGFALDWKSFGSTIGPSAAFTGPDTIQELNAATFTDQSSNAVSWNWDFGNGNAGTGQMVNEVYTTPGTYTVVLEVTDAAGCADTAHHTLVVDPEVSLDPENEVGHLSIWPNPAREQVNVQYTFSGSRQLTWSLTDVVGRSIYQDERRVKDGFTTQVNVSNLAKGIYFLKVESAQGSLVRKVVIE